MDTVNYYVPSESHTLLHPETSLVKQILYQFQIEKDAEKLYLRCLSNESTETEEIPKRIQEQICLLNKQRKLTDAAVNNLLLPLKQSLTAKINTEGEEFLDLSQFSTARGYVTKENKIIALFDHDALQPYHFCNTHMLGILLRIDNNNLVIRLMSKEYILENMGQVIFTFLMNDKLYQVTTTASNELFILQRITKINSMQYENLFRENIPLPDIYQQFTKKQSNLRKMLHLK